MKKIATFLFLVVIFFAVSYGGLSFLGMVPPEVDEFNYRFLSELVDFTATSSKPSLVVVPEVAEAEISESVLPARIIIPKIGVDSAVMNPETRDPVVLDQAL